MLRGYRVAAPRPNRVPRPGTLELCHIRAWFSMATMPRPRISFCWMWFHSMSRVAPPSEKIAGRHVDELAVGKLLDEGLVAGLLHQLGDPVHRAFEVPYLPVGGARGPVQNLGRTVRVDVELKDRRALGAERPFVVRAARVALDVDDLAVDGVDERAAADRAVGTDARRDLGIFDPELLSSGDNRSEIDAGADKSRQRGTHRLRQQKIGESHVWKLPWTHLQYLLRGR